MNLTFIYLLLSLGFLSLYSFILGLCGLFSFPFLWPGFIPFLFFLSRFLIRLSKIFLTPVETLLVGLLFLQFLLYSLGLFVPETGFDALWYHLPEAQVYAATGLVAPIPELMYSTMPRLGEIYFALALLFFPSLILVKSASLIFAIILSFISYLTSRIFLPRPLALLAALTLNSLYLIAWQSTSAYVDIIAAVFQLASLYCLLKQFSSDKLDLAKRWLLMSGIFSGFALGVKIQSLTHLIAMLLVVIFTYHHKSVKKIISHISYLIVPAIFIAAPWYLINYLQSGHPLYPTNLSSLQQATLNYAGAHSLFDWLLHQTLRLPLLFWDLTFRPKDHLSPILLILLPLLLSQSKKIIKNRLLLSSTIYHLLSLIFWWFLPPTETRYLLGALPPLVILEIWAVSSLSHRYLKIKQLSYLFIYIAIGLNFILRSASSFKYLPVILGRITPSQYLHGQTNDFNRPIVEKFYSGYWQSYQYP